MPLRAFGQLIDAVTAARAEQAAAAAAQALPEEVPDDFLDPITMELMRDPVVLPDSQIVVDRWAGGAVCGCGGRGSGVQACGAAGLDRGCVYAAGQQAGCLGESCMTCHCRS